MVYEFLEFDTLNAAEVINLSGLDVNDNIKLILKLLNNKILGITVKVKD